MGVDTSATKFVIADADKGGFDGSDEVFTIASGGNTTINGNIVVTGEPTFGPGGTGTDVINVIADGGSGAAG